MAAAEGSAGDDGHGKSLCTGTHCMYKLYILWYAILVVYYIRIKICYVYCILLTHDYVYFFLYFLIARHHASTPPQSLLHLL